MKFFLLTLLLLACNVLLSGQTDTSKTFANIRYGRSDDGSENYAILEFWKPGVNIPVKILDLKERNPFGKFKEKVVGYFKEYETPIYQLETAKSQIDSFILVSPERHLLTSDLVPYELYSFYSASELPHKNKSLAVAYQLAALNRDGANIATTSIIYVYDSLGNLVSQTPIMDVSCERPACSPDGRFIFFKVGGPYGTEIGGGYVKDEFWVYDTKEAIFISKFPSVVDPLYGALTNGFFIVNDMTTYFNEGYCIYYVYDFYAKVIYTMKIPGHKAKYLVETDSEGFMFLFHRKSEKRYKKYFATDFEIQKIE